MSSDRTDRIERSIAVEPIGIVAIKCLSVHLVYTSKATEFPFCSIIIAMMVMIFSGELALRDEVYNFYPRHAQHWHLTERSRKTLQQTRT